MATAEKINLQVIDGWPTKYRPRVWSELAGQADAIAYLKGTLARKALPNAMMIVGPSGTGKTTLARMYARYINCDTLNACGKCGSCKLDSSVHPDITEMNAADARGIDEIRSLITKSRYSPKHNVRVFIVDEAHQLTPQAAQAFLVPLEKPPGKSMYILCTTDPQKFPAAILGRCTQVRLDLPERDLIATRLTRILELEKEKLPTKAIEACVEASGGHVRDAVSLLEKAVSFRAGNPKADLSTILNHIALASDVECVKVATKMLLGMYLGKPSVVVKAVFDVVEPTQTLNMSINLNQYLLGTLVNTNSRHIWHSPVNREFKATAEKHAKTAGQEKLSLATLLKMQSKLVGLRNEMHNVPASEVSMFLAKLST